MLQIIHRYRNVMTVGSGILIGGGIAAGTLGLAVLRDFLLIAAAILAGVPIAVRAYQALRMKVFSIELLVTIAVIGALYIQEYIESAVVTFLFLFGAYLESRTLEKTRSSLQALIDEAPQEAVVRRDGEEITIPADEVAVGDRLIIRSGGKVPADGRIAAGHAVLNEAAITGESLPVTKEPDDHVFSGTIVDSGYIEVIAEKVGEDTTFAKIIELVEEAQEAKSPAEKYLDRFARYYTPAVVVFAVLVYVLTRDLHMAITFLVVACPGALVIGAPVSTVAGIGNGARNGVLIKGGEVMDRLAKIDAVVLDKTGTLTKGAPEVTEVRSFGDLSDEELLLIAAEAERISEHHLGRAIVQAAHERNLQLAEDKPQGEVIKGGGIQASVRGHTVTIGNRKLMQERGILLSDEAGMEAVMEAVIHAEQRERAGHTAVYVAVDGRVAGVISIADQIREDAKEALAALRRNGVKKFIMLTGDNRHTAKLVGDELGLDEVHAELLPQDKAAYVEKLKAEGYVVAMAGDGINDAPAIAAADIGLAMGEGGTDVSMETADVVLMADKLSQFAHAHSLARATMRNMKQNTWFAVAVVAVLLVGVLSGDIHLASGMFIHEASVLIVILNAMRLIRYPGPRGGGTMGRVERGEVMREAV
ncbi:haloacid dehalogenase [Insulibacter thermoxylanivorax]|uniref:Cd(2+)-exporting ATPase n=1 Tax=Insulibacter thermoxylanivorax TaxID=2749268 RepID=A0A916VFI8_9BACL|nr:cation-translocating P-type ATPase [Insulibacter thermoxylanivorax]GFR37928.1 haloacid dehalogenase [Insulibacter thermoxylanivorax]